MSRRASATTSSRRRSRKTAPPPTPLRRWALPLVSLAAVAAAAAVIAIVASQGPGTAGQTGNRPAASTGAALVVPSATAADSLADGTTLGRPAAPVTVEVWSDYQCPFCGQFARSYLPRLVDDFVAPGSVRILAEDIAFLDRGSSTESTDAAAAASCAAPQGRFWAFHDLLMWNQSGENAGAFSDRRLQAMAARLDLDVGAWNACRVAGSTARGVADRTGRASALGIVSTPTLVINGQAIVGLPKTYDMLAAAIRAAIPAGAAGAAGVAGVASPPASAASSGP
jgi:protein-disulfide isomerase